MLTEQAIKLGQKVKCRVTGFIGVVNGRAEWINGCIQYSVKSEAGMKDGILQMGEGYWIDEIQLDVVDEVSVLDRGEKRVPSPTGGPITKSEYRP